MRSISSSMGRTLNSNMSSAFPCAEAFDPFAYLPINIFLILLKKYVLSNEMSSSIYVRNPEKNNNNSIELTTARMCIDMKWGVQWKMIDQLMPMCEILREKNMLSLMIQFQMNIETTCFVTVILFGFSVGCNKNCNFIKNKSMRKMTFERLIKVLLKHKIEMNTNETIEKENEMKCNNNHCGCHMICGCELQFLFAF